MPLADTYVRARINGRMKRKAEAALAAMGLTVSDAIRLTLTRIAEEKRLPFDVKTPTPVTKAAIAELKTRLLNHQLIQTAKFLKTSCPR